jgi:hypothetical protein
LAVLATITLVLGACGGASGPGVASVGSNTTTTLSEGQSQAPITAADLAKDEQYAQCMRAHGIPNWPDPTADGGFPIPKGKFNARAYPSAMKACQHLLPVRRPTGGAGTSNEQQLAASLKFARCMRAHGEVHFPDPVVEGGQPGQAMSGYGFMSDTASYHRAYAACKSLNPWGSPFSN